MSGWDRDESGDYTPPDPPAWVWGLAGAICLAIVAALVWRG